MRRVLLARATAAAIGALAACLLALGLILAPTVSADAHYCGGNLIGVSDALPAGTPWTGTLAHACLDPGDELSDVTIDWGDGTTSAATVTYDSFPGYELADVSATHTFLGPANPARITISAVDEQSGTPVPFASNLTIYVTPHDSFHAVAIPTPRKSLRFSGMLAVAHVRLWGPGNAVPAATVYWGDGTNTQATFRRLGNTSTFQIDSSHRWKRPGHYTILVDFDDTFQQRRFDLPIAIEVGRTAR